MKNLYDLLPSTCPRLAVSAIFCQNNQRRIATLWDADPEFIIWTDMCRRRIFFDVLSFENPAMSCGTCIRLDLQNDPNQKVIWYTNSKKKAKESFVPSAENILDA